MTNDWSDRLQLISDELNLNLFLSNLLIVILFFSSVYKVYLIYNEYNTSVILTDISTIYSRNTYSK